MTFRSKALRLVRARGGGAAVVYGAAAPALVGLSLLVSDFAGAFMLRDALQRIADTAALTGAQELIVAGKAQSNVAVASAEAYAESLSETLPVEISVFSAQAEVFDQDGQPTLRIKLEAQPKSLFGAFSTPPLMGASASARPAGARSLCVMSLSQTGVGATVAGGGRIEANGCSVQVGSSENKALVVRGGGTISAAQVSVVGGYDGSSAAVTPTPLTDAPSIEDPLKGRPKPSAGSCDWVGKALNRLGQVWSPGTYCGGMYLNNGAQVQLQPGVYILKGGTLNVEGGAKLSGEGVTLFLTDGARLNVLANSELDLSAPETGKTAGMLIMGDADAPATSAHKLTADRARNLLGAIYLPKAQLNVGGANPVADQSPWTALVVERLVVQGQGRVILNSRYADTPVPVPGTLLGAQTVRLTD